MSTLTFPNSAGRLMTLTNLTAIRLGVAGVVLGPNQTRTISARKVYGHRTYMSSMATLVQQSKLKVTFEGDVLSQAETGKIDAPLSGDLVVVRQVFTNVLAAVDHFVKTSWTAAAAANTYTMSKSMDFARNVTVTATTGGGEALLQKTFIINGTDIDGHPLSESLVVGALGAGTSAVTQGVKAFLSVTSVYVPGDASVAPGAYEVGFGNILGLSHSMTQGFVLAEFLNNGAVGGAGTIVFAATSTPYGTYTPFDAPNNTNDYVIVYMPN